MWEGVEARNCMQNPILWEIFVELRERVWEGASAWRQCASIVPGKWGFHLEVLSSRKKKNVFDKKGKLPGHCGTPKDRLGKGRCEDAVVTMWASQGSGESGPQAQAQFYSPSCGPQHSSEVCLPTSSSPMPHTTDLQTHSLFLLSNPFFSPSKPIFFLCPRLGLQWHNK